MASPRSHGSSAMHDFVGQAGILRPIANRPLVFTRAGGLPIRRRLPACPTAPIHEEKPAEARWQAESLPH